MSQRTKKQCSIDGCGSESRARGFCQRHYRRWHRHGDPHYAHPYSKAEVCSVEGCERKRTYKKYCPNHQYKFKKYGDPLAGKTYYKNPEDAISARSREEGSCLIWEGSKNHDGYGFISFQSKTRMVHSVVWEMKYGKIPEGRQINHTCWNRDCVSVDHLEMVTRSQNSAYRSGPNAKTTSGVRNVYWIAGAWNVRVGKNGRQHYFGRYSAIEEAAQVAEQARKDLFGEFAGKG